MTIVHNENDLIKLGMESKMTEISVPCRLCGCTRGNQIDLDKITPPLRSGNLEFLLVEIQISAKLAVRYMDTVRPVPRSSSPIAPSRRPLENSNTDQWLAEPMDLLTLQKFHKRCGVEPSAIFIIILYFVCTYCANRGGEGERWENEAGGRGNGTADTLGGAGIVVWFSAGGRLKRFLEEVGGGNEGKGGRRKTINPRPLYSTREMCRKFTCVGFANSVSGFLITVSVLLKELSQEGRCVGFSNPRAGIQTFPRLWSWVEPEPGVSSKVQNSGDDLPIFSPMYMRDFNFEFLLSFLY
ncbi:hypothetical protein C8R46DRAFT_1046072 [Mycena filopes]|nr:hypothetical protein C8R46DRAFT_1046072 [Mycena filopes]